MNEDIKALQNTLGISYKDAAHRLFMAKIERVKKADSAANAFSAIWTRIDQLVAEEIWPPINAIDKGDFDNYIFENGKWVDKSNLDTQD